MLQSQITAWIITITILGCLHPGMGAWLKCYKGSVKKYRVSLLQKSFSLMTSDCIDRSVPTVVYTFGYMGRSLGPATTAVLEAYLSTKKRNVILLDWEEEARSGILGIPLGYALYAVPNAKKIGNELGEALVSLARAGLNMTHVHLVGHSLGAHIMGYAGRHSREKGYIIPRITGLDPARAMFEGTLAIQNGLDRTCAKFVDVVHSDPGGYGTSQPAGTVDFWPNYVGEGALQPGCPLGDHKMFSSEDLCSHDRAWQYFVEAIKSPTSFLAISARNIDDWIAKANGSTTSPYIFLGDLVSIKAKGNYYFTTNSKVPFSKERDGLQPDTNQTRRRRNSTLPRLLKYFR